MKVKCNIENCGCYKKATEDGTNCNEYTVRRLPQCELFKLVVLPKYQKTKKEKEIDNRTD